MMESRTLDCLARLEFGNLSEEWIKAVWDSDFITFEDQDVSADSDDLQELYGCLKGWCQTSDKDQDLWSVLVENDISYKAFVVYLASFIHTGQKKHVDPLQLEVGIHSARVYCQLSLVKGSGAFHIFNPQLLDYIITLLKLLLKADSSTAASKSRASVESQGRRSGKRGKSKQKGKRRKSSMEVDDGDEGEEEEDTEVAPHIVRHLTRLLVDLVCFLDKFSLFQYESSARSLAKLLCQLTRNKCESFDGNFSTRSCHEKMGVPALAFQGLRSLCSPVHKLKELMLLTISKELLPSLLMLVDGKPVPTIHKPLQLMQEHTVQFISVLMTESGEKGSQYVRALLQHMCIDVPDRAEYRTKVSQTVITLAHKMSDVAYCKMVQWLCKITHHKEASVRGFSVEVVSELLSTPERRFSDEVETDLSQCTTHRHLLQVILDSCSDDNPTVRCRAITTFGHCLVSQEEGIMGMLREIVTPQVGQRPPNLPPRLIPTPGPSVSDTDASSLSVPVGPHPDVTGNQTEASTIRTETPDNQQGTSQAGETLLRTLHVTPACNPYLSDCDGVFSMLRRRARDVKVNVRKASIQALKNAVLFEAPNYTKQNLEVLREHCRDPGLSARKQALVSLSDLLLQIPHDTDIQKMWLEGCLPLVIDRETTMSDKSMETLHELILSNIVTHQRSTSPKHHLAWSLLTVVSQPHNVDMRRYLQKACSTWSRTGVIKPALFSAIQSHVETKNKSAALMLMSEIVPGLRNINPTFLLNYWHNQNQDLTVEDMCRVLTVLKYVAPNMTPTDRQALLEDLKTRVLKFESPTELVAPIFRTLPKVCSKKEMTDFCKEVMNESDKFLSKVLLETQDQGAVEEQMVCHLLTLGEVVQQCPAWVTKRIFLIVESMISSPRITQVPPSQPCTDRQSHPGTDTQSQLGTDKETDHHSIGSEDNSNHDSESSRHSQGSQGTQGTQSTQPLSQFRGCLMSPRVRTFAFITLGKLCLQHEKLAKKYLPALANELDTSDSAPIRNNVMLIICDLSVRYTTAANMYVPNIFVCLKDPCPLIRKQVLNQITRLLQDEFIKWKDQLFFRFITTLLDDVSEIKDFGEFCLIHTLLPRHPNLIYTHFVECIFHFNDYRAHKKYNSFCQKDKERQLFCLVGENKSKNRKDLYQFMLKHMTDVQKFQIQEKLCHEVLGEMADNLLPLCPETTDIMRDTLFILCCKEIKLSGTNNRHTEEALTDEQQNVATLIAAAKKSIYSHYHMKNLLENVVPTVISLKHMLEKKRSPLLRDVMLYLKELLKDYKEEVKEIISGDKQLASEIEFAARKFDEEQQTTPAQQPEAAPPNNQASPIPGRSPAPSAPSTPSRTPRVPTLKISAGTPLSSPKAGPRLVSPLAQKTGAGSTPNRPVPLLRKAMAQSTLRQKEQDGDELKSQQLVPPASGPASPVPSTSTDSFTDTTSTVEAMDTEEMAQPVEGDHVTPMVRASRHVKKLRAISTPSVAMGNITFHGESNLSSLPSPIQEDVGMKYGLSDDSSTSLTPAKEKDDKENQLP